MPTTATPLAPGTNHEQTLLQRLAAQVGIALQQSALHSETRRLAVVDSLTQVANRRQFDAYLTNMWKQHLRDHTPLALILADIDFFKLYNDTYGHQGGDRCLRTIADSLKQQVKRPHDLVARYGGEEFAAILPQASLAGAQGFGRNWSGAHSKPEPAAFQFTPSTGPKRKAAARLLPGRLTFCVTPTYSNPDNCYLSI